MKKKILLLGTIMLFGIISLQAQTYELWGTTYEGGEDDIGTLFKTNINTLNTQVLDDFSENRGENPKDAILLEDGRIIGVASNIIYIYDPLSSTYEIKQGVSSYAFIQIMQHSNGLFYLITSSYYGINLYQYNLETNELNFLLNNYDLGSNVKVTDIIEGTNNKIYGLNRNGGEFYKGCLWEYDVETNNILKKVDFDGNNGEDPNSNLVVSSDGKIYGTTEHGGEYGKGVLFVYYLNSDNQH